MVQSSAAGADRKDLAIGASGWVRAGATGKRMWRGYEVRLPQWNDPRLHLTIVTVALQILGQTVFKFELSITQILIPIVVCGSFEFGLVFFKERALAWPASALQAANGIGLILRVPGTEHGDWWSFHGWWVFALAGFIAVASKYVFRWGGRHVFNPSNFALVASFLVLGQEIADPQILWWGPLDVGLVLAFLIILAGSVAITRRVGQMIVSMSFWLVFALLIGLLAVSGHAMHARWSVDVVSDFRYWMIVVTSPEILVFTFFMLTDPRTTPRGKVARSLFAALVGIVASVILSFQSTEFGTKVGLLAALVMLCPTSFIFDRYITTSRTDVLTYYRDFFLGAAVPVRQRVQRVAAAGSLIAILVASLIVISEHFGAQDVEGVNVDLRNRVETIAYDYVVAVDPNAEVTALPLTESLAAQIAADVTHSHSIYAAAQASGDAELLTAGYAGPKLVQLESQIASGLAAGITFSFDQITLTAVRLGTTHQSPPDLAVLVTGTMMENGVESTMDTMYTVSNAGGHYVVTNEYGEDGNPVVDTSTIGLATENALEPSRREASADVLARLQFEDVSSEWGLDFNRAHDEISTGSRFRLAPVAIGDFNSDGRPDVFLGRDGQPGLLLQNTGTAFVDVTAQSGLSGVDVGFDTSAVWVDLNGDGHLDLIVAGGGGRPNRLYINEGDGTFIEQSDSWNLPQGESSDPDSFVVSIAVGDFNGDERLDVAFFDGSPHGALERLRADNELEDSCALRSDPQGPFHRYDPETSSATRLLLNNGSDFRDVTAQLGVNVDLLSAQSAVVQDLDGNGSLDIVVAGRICSTSIFANDGDGNFTEVAGEQLPHIPRIARSVAIIESVDQKYVIFSGTSYPTASGVCPLVGHLVTCEGNTAFELDTNGEWVDATDELGIEDGLWSFGTQAGDFNATGSSDLLSIDGFRSIRSEELRNMRNPNVGLYDRSKEFMGRLWLNPAEDRSPWPDAYEDVGLTPVEGARSVVAADFTGDSLLDIMIVPTAGPPRMFENATLSRNNAVTLKLNDESSPNYFGIGAQIAVLSKDGVTLQHRTVSPNTGYQASGDTITHFGLGDASDVRILITWPDGDVTTHEDVEVNSFNLLTKG